MKGRWVILGLATMIVVLLATGLSFAAQRASAPTAATPGSRAWHDQMHDSPWMQRMRSQMPSDLQKQCNDMHARMDEWFTQHPGQTFGPMIGGGQNQPGGTGNWGGMMGGRMMQGFGG